MWLGGQMAKQKKKTNGTKGVQTGEETMVTQGTRKRTSTRGKQSISEKMAGRFHRTVTPWTVMALSL